MPRATMNEEQKKEFGKFHEYYAEMLAPKIFITVREYAEANGTSIQDVRSMLLAGEMPGAYIVTDTVRIPVNGMTVAEAKEAIAALGKKEFSIEEISQIFSVVRRTAYRWATSGKLRSRKDGWHAPMVSLEDLLEGIKGYDLQPYYKRDQRCNGVLKGV